MISDKKLYLRRIGLVTPTVVEYGNQILVTNQLDMEKTCNMWRWYFQLPFFFGRKVIKKTSGSINFRKIL